MSWAGPAATSKDVPAQCWLPTPWGQQVGHCCPFQFFWFGAVWTLAREVLSLKRHKTPPQAQLELKHWINETGNVFLFSSDNLGSSN